MPWGYAATAVGSYLGSKSKGGGGGGGGSANTAYVPKDQAGIDQRFLDSTKGQQGTLDQMWSNVSPYNQQLLQNQMGVQVTPYNNPYAASMQDITNQAAGMAGGAGQHLQTAAGQNWRDYQDVLAGNNRSNQQYQANIGYAGERTRNLTDLGSRSNQTYDDLMAYQKGQLGDIKASQKNLYGGGNRVLDTAFDPQNALYNRTLGQVTEQSRAAQYARGIQASPYGAALENLSNENFNIDWQNQQLARQTQGLSAAQGAYGSAQNMGNSYTQNMSGLQTAQNQNYAMLAQEAQNQYLGALNAERANAYAGLQAAAAQQGLAQNTDQALVQNTLNQGQLPYQAAQQIYGNQTQGTFNQLGQYGLQQQGLANYQNAFSPYLSGQSNLQSQYLNYLGYGSGAQANAFNQNAYNQQQRANAISTIAGPLGEGLSKGSDYLFNNTDWGNSLYNSWFGGSL